MQVRNYKSSDFSQVEALYKDKSAYGGNYDDTRDTAGRLQAASQDGNMFVAEDSSGKILGAFIVLENRHSFWLLRFAVDPKLDNAQEVAKLLTTHAYAIAQQKGHSNIIVYVDPDDKNLETRYKELGFNKGGLYQSYWKEVIKE